MADESSSPLEGSRFHYQAIEPVSGITRHGELNGSSAFEVRAALRRIGLQPVAIEPIVIQDHPRWARPLWQAWESHLRQRRQPIIADLCQSLATLLRAGVTLDEALAIITSSPTRAPAERSLTSRLRDAIRDGHPFSLAASAEPSWFDRFDVALIAAGQQAGDLSATLQAAATHHRRAGSIGQRLFVALAYPVVLGLAGLGVIIFLGVHVLPQLASLLTQAHQPVPGLTSFIIHLGHALLWGWPVFIATVLIMVIGAQRLARRIPITSRLGRHLHGNPFARLRRRYRAGRFAWSLARLLGAGMTVTDALAVVANTLHDQLLKELVLEAQAAITRGEDFSAVIARSPVLDPEVAQLIRVGERSGELAHMLEQIAEHAFLAADTAMDRVAALIGPLAIVILAGLVGILALACILPLSRLGDLL